jgi:hypothetical protein
MSLERVKWQTERILPTFIEISVFGGTVSHILVLFGKPLFTTYQTPRLHISEDKNLHSHGHVSPRYHFCLQLVDIVLALRELLSVPCRISLSSLSNRSNGKSFVFTGIWRFWIFVFAFDPSRNFLWTSKLRRTLLLPPQSILLVSCYSEAYAITTSLPVENLRGISTYRPNTIQKSHIGKYRCCIGIMHIQI